MAKQKYTLNDGERILYKSSYVRHGFWGAYVHKLAITNQSVILEKYGVLNNFKGIERYDYDDITQAIHGKAFNGETQLELYIRGKVENFALQSGDDNELKTIVMAINDQMGPDADYFDFSYYQDIVNDGKDINRMLELKAKAQDDGLEFGDSGFISANSVAKNILKSGDLSTNGIIKGVTKAANKQKKKGILGGIKDELLDGLGVRDLQDEFTEIGNEFREGFGLKTKMTYAEKKELEDLEEKIRNKEIQKIKDTAFQDKVYQQKFKINAQKNLDSENKKQNINFSKISVKEQMELLQQIKNLLDDGILTQEEFEQKKKEILKS